MCSITVAARADGVNRRGRLRCCEPHTDRKARNLAPVGNVDGEPEDRDDRRGEEDHCDAGACHQAEHGEHAGEGPGVEPAPPRGAEAALPALRDQVERGGEDYRIEHDHCVPILPENAKAPLGASYALERT